MSSFLDHIAMRSAQTPAVMRPRRRSMFEPDPGLAGEALFPLEQAAEPQVQPPQLFSTGTTQVAGPSHDLDSLALSPGVAAAVNVPSIPQPALAGQPSIAAAAPVTTPLAAIKPAAQTSPPAVQRRAATDHAVDGSIPPVPQLEVSLPSIDSGSRQVPRTPAQNGRLADPKPDSFASTKAADRRAPQSTSFRPIEPMVPQPAASLPAAPSLAPLAPAASEPVAPQRPARAVPPMPGTTQQQPAELRTPAAVLQHPVTAAAAMQGALSMAVPLPREVDPGPGQATIEVHIGRVEFASPTPPPVRPAAPELPSPSLDSFLAGRRG